MSSVLAFLHRPLLVTPAGVVDVAIAFVLVGLVLIGWSLLAQGRLRRRVREAERGAGDATDRLEAILRAQTEMTGRMQTMAEIFGSRQADLTRVLSDRLDGLTHRVGHSIQETTRETRTSLGNLAERLAAIDKAQAEIAALAGEMVQLQDILSDKQARGAFGQARMEAIIRDGLPPGGYSFQATLSNGKRPDCLILMPNGAPGLAIDAKFPLESWSGFRQAEDDATRSAAAQRLRRDMDVHVRAISEKYLIAGETQETAFLFVPSEAIVADLHDSFPDIVQRAYRARVVIVSPTLMMVCVQVVQALTRNARMRREAGRIQQEVRLLMEDLARLDARVGALKSHFVQTGRDVDQILVSTGKLLRRSERIEAVELGDAAGEEVPQAEGQAAFSA
ncbi:DNA recombination protein RmuC [Mangrovibrevibacter kandeliae]|uniref:DNA recombination protein RmuC n=1 Tax=Mangrovibrevibacter kandeliae TaxID=2968473 RepID=UPI0021173943|nr:MULTISPECIES: DNA recombination protein RmuC [unclassified Aurantimonas]MCQ8783459.1 DNA recombination protein RmuC [Aurantimonas sp. CSK15Z-1]MCW4116025.1 DNA recombination protein RmuC [Aurantimonas sp. MSK8Z-1]